MAMYDGITGTIKGCYKGIEYEYSPEFAHDFAAMYGYNVSTIMAHAIDRYHNGVTYGVLVSYESKVVDNKISLTFTRNNLQEQY